MTTKFNVVLQKGDKDDREEEGEEKKKSHYIGQTTWTPEEPFVNFWLMVFPPKLEKLQDRGKVEGQEFLAAGKWSLHQAKDGLHHMKCPMLKHLPAYLRVQTFTPALLFFLHLFAFIILMADLVKVK